MKMQNKLNSRFEQNLACIIQPPGILAKRRASQIISQSAEEALPFLKISASLMIFNIRNIIFPSAEEEDLLITYCVQKYFLFFQRQCPFWVRKGFIFGSFLLKNSIPSKSHDINCFCLSIMSVFLCAVDRLNMWTNNVNEKRESTVFCMKDNF